MARKVEDILIEILGKQAFQIALLQAQVEDLTEKIKKQEGKLDAPRISVT